MQYRGVIQSPLCCFFWIDWPRMTPSQGSVYLLDCLYQHNDITLSSLLSRITCFFRRRAFLSVMDVLFRTRFAKSFLCTANSTEFRQCPVCSSAICPSAHHFWLHCVKGHLLPHVRPFSVIFYSIHREAPTSVAKRKRRTQRALLQRKHSSHATYNGRLGCTKEGVVALLTSYHLTFASFFATRRFCSEPPR